MEMSASSPPITLRSTCMTFPHTHTLNTGCKQTTLKVLRQYHFHIPKLGNIPKSGELALGWAPEVRMPHERMSVMLWTLAVLSAIMGLLLILTAQAVPS